MIYRILVLTLLTTGFAATSQAQVYKWTDENGKTHFSDRKPEERHADDVSEDLKQVNVTDSTPTSDFGTALPETAAEKQVRSKEEREKQRLAANQQKQCAIARNRLKQLSGPVYFERPDGSTYEISEKDRAEKEQQLRRSINRHCN